MPKLGLRVASALVAVSAAAAGSVVAASTANAWDPAVWDKVAYCESTNRWSINTGNGFYGGLQFTVSTWNEFGGQQFAWRADYATKAEQIAVARRVLYGQGPGAWPVCSVYAGLTKSNGGADPNAMPVGSTSTTAPTTGDTISYRKQLLDVDGVMGPLTITEMQKWAGSYPDGIWGPNTSRALQRKVGAAVTGVRDRQTTYRVQAYVGADQDGIWGRQTTSYLQSFLNKR